MLTGNGLYQNFKKRNINVHCFGDGWINGRVTDEDIEQIFVSSKINLNISNSISYDIRYLLSSLRNLHLQLNRF